MFSTPLTGMQNAGTLLDNAASRIASPDSGSAVLPARGDSVVLSEEVASLMMALNQFEMNSKALEAEVNMAELSVNLVA